MSRKFSDPQTTPSAWTLARQIAARACPASPQGWAAAAAVGLSLAAFPASAKTFTVKTLADSGTGSLRDAVAQANALAGADKIVFASSISGIVGTTIPLTSGQIFITDDVTITGPGPDRMIINGSAADRIFYLNSGGNVTITGLTLTNGNTASSGGALYCNTDALVLTNVVITGNVAGNNGGGFYSNSCSLRVSDSVISNNTAANNGGGVYLEDTSIEPYITSFQNTRITGNTATAGYGGGIYMKDPDDGPIILNNVIMTGNTAGTHGGGLWLYDTDNAPVTISNSDISGNTADQKGGGIYLYEPDDPVLILNTSITGNTATNNDGGGIYLYDGYAGLSIENSTIANNTAGGNGGGAYLYGTDGNVRFVNSTISGNTAAGDGGGIFADDDVLLINTLLGDNTGAAGPDIYSAAGDSVVLISSLVEDDSDFDQVPLTGAILNVDPLLGTLADQGGVGPTVPLTGFPTPSPAIDAGDSEQCAVFEVKNLDQRGVRRNVVDGDFNGLKECDIGAYEFNGNVVDGGCPAAPAACQTLPKAALSILNKPGITADTFKLTGSGLNLTTAFFGNPSQLAGTGNILCVYSNGTLVGSLASPAGEPSTTGASLWKLLAGGKTSYSNTSGNPDGLTAAAQNPGTGMLNASISFTGGKRLTLPQLPLTAPVVVQNLLSNGNCVDAEFNFLKVNNATTVTATTP